VDFSERFLNGLVSGVHILPFFPWSSDDGFSVIDYLAVNPMYGDWEDIDRLGRSFHLMFDAVINHISAESPWFKRFLRDDPKYRNYFITIEASDLSHTVRLGAAAADRIRHPIRAQKVWTTFSDDQIDGWNPEVLEIVDVLLHYIAHGGFHPADAIAYSERYRHTGITCPGPTVIQLFGLC
jgi:sucrose phosphorylase